MNHGRWLSIAMAAAVLFSAAVPVRAADEEAEEEDEPSCSVILNEAELDPEPPACEELEEYVDDLLEELTDEDMDTYEKVVSCYDYLVDTVSYGSHLRYLGTPLGDTTCRAIYSEYGEVEGFGAVALSAGVGMCNAYASAFILMTRSLGLDSHLVEGSTRSGSGSYAYHKWAEIDIDGETYVFDPQLEQSLRRYGLSDYSVFCKTYDEIPDRYIRSARND